MLRAAAVAAARRPTAGVDPACQRRFAHTHHRYALRPTQGVEQKHDHVQLPLHHSSFFNGRLAHMRVPMQRKMVGRLWRRDRGVVQYNVDVWIAQETLRRQTKARDWEVVEVPYRLAPAELQRVIPEKHTELPQMVDAGRGDGRNVRNLVFDREAMQDVLYSKHAEKPYPTIRRVERSPGSATLDTFFSH